MIVRAKPDSQRLARARVPHGAASLPKPMSLDVPATDARPAPNAPLAQCATDDDALQDAMQKVIDASIRRGQLESLAEATSSKLAEMATNRKVKNGGSGGRMTKEVQTTWNFLQAQLRRCEDGLLPGEDAPIPGPSPQQLLQSAARHAQDHAHNHRALAEETAMDHRHSGRSTRGCAALRVEDGPFVGGLRSARSGRSSAGGGGDGDGDGTDDEDHDEPLEAGNEDNEPEPDNPGWLPMPKRKLPNRKVCLSVLPLTCLLF